MSLSSSPAVTVPEPSTFSLTGESTEAMQAQAAEACIRLLPGWDSEPGEQPQVEPIGGGITNALFKVRKPSTGACAVVRKFGHNTEVFIDRELETRSTLQLNAFGFGSTVLALFENGRIETHLSGRTLEPDDMALPQLVPLIAAQLARFHLCRVCDVPLEPQLWRKITGWLDLVQTLHSGDGAAVTGCTSPRPDLPYMRAQLAEVERFCDRVRSPTVFCHNDLLSGNIMARGVLPGQRFDGATDPGLTFIDFEYGCYNPRGFDLGNHFNEWAGFDCKWERYPSPEQQASFLRAYLRCANGAEPTQEDVDRARVEANAFALASHLFWGVWALLQAHYSAVDFDYAGYSTLRWNEYRRRRGEVQRMVDAALL